MHNSVIMRPQSKALPPGYWKILRLDKIMYAYVPIGGMNVMFMDMPAWMELCVGNNFSPMLSLDSADEFQRVFAALSCGNATDMQPAPTFFSPLYAMVTDKYGIIWQLLLNEVA